MEIKYFKYRYKEYIANFSTGENCSLWAFDKKENSLHFLGHYNGEIHPVEKFSTWDVQHGAKRLYLLIEKKYKFDKLIEPMKKVMGRPKRKDLRGRAIELFKKEKTFRQISVSIKRNVSLVHRWVREELKNEGLQPQI